ncbi:MAG: metallophosphoesterase [Treponema sp.]|nr:metallophosphoesterase [Treponema sp.]
MFKAENTETKIGPVKGFTFIGDPGCSGLGVEIMSVFNACLYESGGDFILVGGDIVPNGTDRFYESVTAMVDQSINKPIYMLAGNHDTLSYEKYFGKKNYFLYNDSLLLIALDDSGRVFTREALETLQGALKFERPNIVLAFHIPPVNKITQDSVDAQEWLKVSAIIKPFKDKIKYILCGHIHSYFEDDIDGIKLIATGGGGARMDEVPGIRTPYYHFVDFYFDNNGKLQYNRKFVEFSKNELIKNEDIKNESAEVKSIKASPVREAMEEAFAGECRAHVRYRLYAEDALKNNNPGLAKLFAAASDSEYHHARNFYYALNGLKQAKHSLSESIAGETYEAETLYPAGVDLAQQYKSGLAVYAFRDACEAEKVHMRLFSAALSQAGEIPEKRYFTCTSCGLTFTGEPNFKFCPVCGAPLGKIREVSPAEISGKEK